MTRLFQTGLETGDLKDFTVTTGSPTVDTSPVYTGDFSLHLWNSTNYANIPIPTPGDVLYISFFTYPDTIGGGNFFSLLDTDNNILLALYVEVGGVVKLYRSSTLIATGAGALLSTDTWSHIEFYAAIANSGGRGVVKLNGVTIIDYTGDTQPGTVTDIYHARLISASAFYFDDIFINDDGGSAPDNTYVGRHRLYSLRPNGAGNYTQWDPSTGSNYQCVDEDVASGTDYVSTSTDDEIDSYALENLSGIPGGATLVAVIPVVEALVDSGSKKIALGVRSGSTDSFGSDKALGPSYAIKSDRFTTDPANGAWSESAINALEVAIKSRA